MRTAALLAALATVAAGSWLGDEYWTLIGHSGRPIQGDAANFARVSHYFKPDEHNRFVAFWMTNTHYAGRMFEQFGEAFKKEEEGEEDKYCARFTGERGEAVEVCENFRILTVPERFRSRTMQVFEWVKIDSIDGLETDKIGYNDHRICAFAYDPSETAAGVKYSDFTFGDAVPSRNVANAVNKLTTKPHSNFDNYLLRLLVDESLTEQSIPRLPAPAGHDQHLAHRQHTERRENVAHMHQQQAQEQQAQQDAEYARRLAEYNERLRQQQAQQQRERDHYDAQQQQVHVQANVQHVQQPQPGSEQQQPLRHICDTYGRVFELTKGEDGRTRYVTYDLAAHGGVRPPCTLIGETPGQSVRVERGEEVPGQRPYPVRRSCSGSRKKKDAEEDC